MIKYIYDVDMYILYISRLYIFIYINSFVKIN